MFQSQDPRVGRFLLMPSEGNPLLHRWQELTRAAVEAEDRDLARWRVTGRFDLSLPSLHNIMESPTIRLAMGRTEAVRRWSWAVPTDEALRLIAQWGPIVEIGAGTGYWAWLLRSRFDADILAYDRHPPQAAVKRNGWHPATPTFTHVRRGTTRNAKRYPTRALFLCWPPMDTMALDALTAYRGDTVIYIGEHGGCNANDAFFDALEAGWDEAARCDLPQWDGIHDALTIYRRRGGATRGRGRAR